MTLKYYSPRQTIKITGTFLEGSVARLPSVYQIEVIDPDGTKTTIAMGDCVADADAGTVTGTIVAEKEGEWTYAVVGLGDMKCADDTGRFVIRPSPFVP